VEQIRKQRHGNIRPILVLPFGLLLQRAKENTLTVVDIYYYLASFANAASAIKYCQYLSLNKSKSHQQDIGMILTKPLTQHTTK
jgi:hypothetical protein